MKKCRKLLLFSGLILLAGALGIIVGDKTQASEVSSIGPSTEYRRNIGRLWLYNNDNSDRGPGEVVCYSSGSAFTGIEVGTCVSYANPLVAGVIPYGSTLTARSYGWVQISGYHPAVVVASNCVRGGYLVSSATNEQAATWYVHGSSFTPRVTAQPSGVASSSHTIQGSAVFGVALDIATGSETVKALIKLR